MRDTSVPDASGSRGHSFDSSMIRVGKVTVIGMAYLRSIVIASSPVMLRIRSVMTAASCLPDNRASPMTAKDLPIRGQRPNGLERLDSVGAAVLPAHEVPC